MLTALDIWLDVARCRPLALSWWAFAPKSPPLSTRFVTDREFGSRFNEPDDPNYNAQGFRDRDDFGNITRKATLRILLLGDSMAYGAAAIYDGSNSGFADLLEEKLNRAMPGGAILWNTGIPGIGQREQLLHIRRYFPIMKPQIVLLAFYANDFEENIYPPGIYYVYTDGTWANRYVLNGHEVRTLTPEEAWLRAKGVPFESASAWLRLRTASLVYRVSRKFATEPVTNNINKIEITKALLREISDYVSQHKTVLIVIVIPPADTMSYSTIPPQHASAIEILQHLGIPFVDMRPHLTLADYTPPPDLHLTKEGHRKVSEALFKPLSNTFVR